MASDCEVEVFGVSNKSCGARRRATAMWVAAQEIVVPRATTACGNPWPKGASPFRSASRGQVRSPALRPVGFPDRSSNLRRPPQRILGPVTSEDAAKNAQVSEFQLVLDLFAEDDWRISNDVGNVKTHLLRLGRRSRLS